MKEALKNASYLGYLNSAQAIADYASVILHIKRKFSTENSPVIVEGGSYGGMLATWFRLKYPHVALGALASSAPILYIENIVQAGYFSIVSKVFKETSKSCYDVIQKSWDEIERIGSRPNGLSILSKKFKTCNPLESTFQLKEYLISRFTRAAQYNYPPTYPVSVICGGMDGPHLKNSDILDQIFAGFVAYQDKYFGRDSCNGILYYEPVALDVQSIGWSWQSCTEMLAMPFGRENNTMFPLEPFSLETFIKKCEEAFGVQPQPQRVTTYYGGHDIKLVLKRFASNIVFSNGLRDPYSAGGVLKNISDTIVAITTVNGSHCSDLLPSLPTDPEWLIEQRKTEVKIIAGWISQYYADLHETEAIKSGSPSQVVNAKLEKLPWNIIIAILYIL